MRSTLFFLFVVGGCLAYFALNEALHKEHSQNNPSRLQAVASFREGDVLFPIFYDQRWGFINQKGQVVIENRYRNAGRFVNGLAPVRENGTYGYINTKGEYVIPPVYDYAVDFSEGLARVWQEGKCFFINQKGQKAFHVPFTEASDFKEGIAKISTGEGDNKREGLIDRTGKYIVQPIYQQIRDFEEGYAVVYGPNHAPWKAKEVNEVGV